MGIGRDALAAMVPCCFFLPASRRKARLVLWGGEGRAARHGKQAGEVMVDFIGTVVCPADGFYIGRPAPVLAIEDRLLAGATYLVLPVDRLPHGNDPVNAASLAALSYDRTGGGGGGGTSVAGGSRSPFEYIKGDYGRTTMIKVTPEFIIKAITARPGTGDGGGASGGGAALCSTPELRKHYEQLVGAARARAWSPRLDTIKEPKKSKGAARLMAAVAVSPGRLSPVAAKLLRLDKEKKTTKS